MDFVATQTSSTTTVYDAIYRVFGIDWRNVQYTSLLKPLYSALAARLKIDAHFSAIRANIPQSVNDQASYWAQNYTFNSKGSFDDTANYYISEVNSTTTCKS
jgi:hypothetical protein